VHKNNSGASARVFTGVKGSASARNAVFGKTVGHGVQAPLGYDNNKIPFGLFFVNIMLKLGVLRGKSQVYNETKRYQRER
jgi:hypothetical protein